ncbi:MAG TPA: acetyl-CoA carboxylase, carboxyltransferase subunit beta [Chthonomonadaceae bacterium]|nr:acetyl-CoA carboxylase, carboxyltransferase subunit beta [Chthonomonadaceae bacterium]
MARGSWLRRHTRNGAAEKTVPDGMWSKCPHCAEIMFARDVERNLSVCPKCDYHHRLSATERLALTVDEGSFEEMDAHLASCDPLSFPDYTEKLERDRARTGLEEGLITGRARIEGQAIVIGIADFGFMGGSMGSVVGEKLARAMETGEKERLPVVLFTASGGARMQEGLISLMQMAKTSAAVARLDRAAVPYIVVLTHPTTGGVYASFASLGDIILAEPGATIAFAGRRVGNQDMGIKLPDDFQTSEFQFRSGMIDRVVPRKEMRPTLGKLLAFFAEDRTNAQQPA